MDVFKQEHLSASYLALNPLGVIPTLIDRGSVLTDSAVIIEYLNEAFHGPPDLMPINAVIRAQARAWCRRLDSTDALRVRSEEHTSELQSLMRISYDVLCMKTKKTQH